MLLNLISNNRNKQVIATPFSLYQSDLGHGGFRVAKNTTKTHLLQPFPYLSLPFQLCMHQLLLLARQLHLILYALLLLYLLQQRAMVIIMWQLQIPSLQLVREGSWKWVFLHFF